MTAIDARHRYLVMRNRDASYVGSTDDLGALLPSGYCLVDTYGEDGLGTERGSLGIPDFLRAKRRGGAAMTEAEIEGLRALLAKATPGPWFAPEDQAVCTKAFIADGGNVICLEPERIMAASLAKWPDNRELIVAAVNNLPALLDLIASQRARIEALEGALRPFARQCPHKNEDGAHGILVPATVADVRNARALSERGA